MYVCMHACIHECMYVCMYVEKISLQSHWKTGGPWTTLFAVLWNQWRHNSVTIAIMSIYRCHSAKVLNTTFGNSIVALATDLWRHLKYNFRGTVYAMFPSNYKRDATWNSQNGKVLVSQTYYSFHSVLRVIVANIYQHLDKLWLLFNCHNQTYIECICPEDFSKFSGVKTDWHSMFIASWPVIMGQMRLQTP